VRESARDTARGARDAARETGREAREGARDVRESARDTARDAREGFRESTRESRESRRDSREFRAESVRSADIGVWFNRSRDAGLVISDIASSGAIARVGFREGDRVVSVGGHRVRSEDEFVRFLFDDDIRDERVKVIVVRDDREHVVFVEPSVLIREYVYVEHDPLEEFGIVLDDRHENRVVVWKVLPRTPAFYAGFRSGDIITTFHGQRVSTSKDFVQLVQKSDPGDVAVQVSRGDRMRDLQVNIPRFGGRGEARTALRPNIDEGVERRAERREDRRDIREDRVEDRQDRSREREGAVEERRFEPQPAPRSNPGRRGGIFRRR
jgi:predicted metalloprotease with PDZ domain